MVLTGSEIQHHPAMARADINKTVTTAKGLIVTHHALTKGGLLDTFFLCSGVVNTVDLLEVLGGCGYTCADG